MASIIVHRISDGIRVLFDWDIVDHIESAPAKDSTSKETSTIVFIDGRPPLPVHEALEAIDAQVCRG